MAENIDKYLDEIDDILDGARPVGFSGKMSVDVEAIRDVIENIRLNLPEEINQAKMLAAERRQIIDHASMEATNAVDDAKIISRDLLMAAEKRSKDMDSETNRRTEEVMKVTQNKAKAILLTARNEADRLVSRENVVAEANATAERIKGQAEAYLEDAKKKAKEITSEADSAAEAKMVAAEKWALDLKKSASAYVDDIVNEAEYRISKSHQEIDELQKKLNVAAGKNRRDTRTAVRHKPEPIRMSYDKHEQNRARNAASAYGVRREAPVSEGYGTTQLIDVPFDDIFGSFNDEPLHDRPSYDIEL